MPAVWERSSGRQYRNTLMTDFARTFHNDNNISDAAQLNRPTVMWRSICHRQAQVNQNAAFYHNGGQAKIFNNATEGPLSQKCLYFTQLKSGKVQVNLFM